MSSFEVCLWFSAVNLITAGFGALVRALLLEGGYPQRRLCLRLKGADG